MKLSQRLQGLLLIGLLGTVSVLSGSTSESSRSKASQDEAKLDLAKKQPIYIWGGLPAPEQSVMAYRALRPTPLGTFPPGIMPLILRYLQPTHAELMARDIFSEAEKTNSRIAQWCEKDGNPLLGLDLLRDPRPRCVGGGGIILIIYWDRLEKEFDGYICCGIDIPPLRSLLMHITVWAQSPRYMRSSCQGVAQVELTGDDAGNVLEMRIADFDATLKCGSILAWCVYKKDENDVYKALLFADRHRLTDEQFAQLEARVASAKK
jgi:hypothetical protein